MSEGVSGAGATGLELPEGSALAFRNLKDAKLLALDIGGSLAKIAYYSTLSMRRMLYEGDDSPDTNPDQDYEVFEGARLHFIKFETKQIEKCIEYIRKTLMEKKDDLKLCPRIYVTGGGAYKYSDFIETKLGLNVIKVDEMKSICAGANFLLTHIVDESFMYDRSQDPHYLFKGTAIAYPYLLVTIGSGVSVIKVESETVFERIGGTATGGGTFWGLGRLLTGAKGFDNLMELATQGDFRNVDMLVKDIYGSRDQDYTSLGLSSTLIASSFGKAIHHDPNRPSSPTNPVMSDADMARSLLYMVSNDVGQIATLYAMLHKVKNIYFGGFFLRHHPVSLHTISYAVNFWSKGEVKANFLRHEGYLGAIGAFLHGCETETTCATDSYSWTENLYGSSSSFPADKVPDQDSEVSSTPSSLSPSSSSLSLIEVTDHLEIDRYETRLGHCPLLDNDYTADTVDLTRDDEARKYWLSCFEDSLPKFTDRAVQSQPNKTDSVQRAERFKEVFLARIKGLRSQPYAHGCLTVRNILDMREQCLIEYGFHDPYLKQKRLENDQAFEILPEVLGDLKTLPDDELQEQLARGLLAGNVFDWGAKEVALLMESEQGLKFSDALKFVKPRPWLVDDLDAWKARLRNGPPHRCAAIFIDNSGVDVVLGVLPFTEFLLSRGTSVMLCANNRPVLNDVTYTELVLIVQRAAKLSSVIDQALKSGALSCENSGQSSACLDLSRLSQPLVEHMAERKVDLIVLEGMGRALHTNLYAKFGCESLKVAVIKNRWLATRLGGDMFSVIFKYES